jgi:hypothetical protein
MSGTATAQQQSNMNAVQHYHSNASQSPLTDGAPEDHARYMYAKYPP